MNNHNRKYFIKRNQGKCGFSCKIVLKNGKSCVIINLPNIVNKQYCKQTIKFKRKINKRRTGNIMSEVLDNEKVLNQENEETFEGIRSVDNNSNYRIVSFEYAARFLTTLFFKSKYEYHCTLPKIEKMLAIADMIGMKNGEDVFVEKIYIKNCGVGFDQLGWPSDIINKRDRISLTTSEDDKPLNDVSFIDTDEFGNEKKIPLIYLYNTGLPESYCELLKKVFVNFANYRASTLGKQIDEFKSYLCVEDENEKGYIDANKLKDFFGSVNGDLAAINNVYEFISSN